MYFVCREYIHLVDEEEMYRTLLAYIGAVEHGQVGSAGLVFEEEFGGVG